MCEKSDENGCGGRKGRPKQSYMDGVNVDLREKGLSGEEMQTGLYGSNLSHTSIPHRNGKRCGGRRRCTLPRLSPSWPTMHFLILPNCPHSVSTASRIPTSGKNT